MRKKSTKWWIGIIIFIILFGIISFYSYSKMKMITRGVDLVATLNKEINSPIITVKGKAKNAINITLNGREIYISKDGNFKEITVVPPGFSVIEIIAKDKLGKVSQKKFKIIHKENFKEVVYQN